MTEEFFQDVEGQPVDPTAPRRVKVFVVAALAAVGILFLILVGYRHVAVDPSDIAAAESFVGDARFGLLQGFTEQGNPTLGDPEAPVVIEEFSSYQCPFCRRYFEESYPQLLADYVETGQVLYVFRDFPLAAQPQSTLAAEAARCAGEQNRYWAMHDQIFENQREWSGRGDGASLFEGYATELGLDGAVFAECLASGASRATVEADAAAGAARGVTGTPTFFINGQALVGAQPYAVIAAAIDAVLAGQDIPTDEPVEFAMPTPASIRPADDALILGDPNAPVTMVEFSDYQCPFCARYFQETWPLLRAEFIDTGRVRYVFKDFPLTSIHPQAPQVHSAARCAGEQGAYWEMHDLLFANQSEWANSSDLGSRLVGYADELGLDVGAFEGCVESGRWDDAVSADVTEGFSLGARGTPTFFVNGIPLVGALPYDTFRIALTMAEQGDLGGTDE